MCWMAALSMGQRQGLLALQGYFLSCLSAISQRACLRVNKANQILRSVMQPLHGHSRNGFKEMLAK